MDILIVCNFCGSDLNYDHELSNNLSRDLILKVPPCDHCLKTAVRECEKTYEFRYENQADSDRSYNR